MGEAAGTVRQKDIPRCMARDIFLPQILFFFLTYHALRGNI
nr:MAG TPA: hypothetical protein [Caudoviricetes sp.]